MVTDSLLFCILVAALFDIFTAPAPDDELSTGVTVSEEDVEDNETDEEQFEVTEGIIETVDCCGG